MPFLEQLHLDSGQLKVKGCPLWGFNGLFLTHFRISIFPWFLSRLYRNSSTVSIMRQHVRKYTFTATGDIYMGVGISLEVFDLSWSVRWLSLIYLIWQTSKVKNKCWYKRQIGIKFLLLFLPERVHMVKSTCKKLRLDLIPTNHQTVEKNSVENIEFDQNLSILVIVFVHTSIYWKSYASIPSCA